MSLCRARFYMATLWMVEFDFFSVDDYHRGVVRIQNLKPIFGESGVSPELCRNCNAAL
jgi:hypothetical protein